MAQPVLAIALDELRAWLGDNELNDAQSDLRLTQLAERLREDRLHVAFVAEFSRGKSELINAIFFADYGNRMLPSSAGRTTMCPTELMYDPNKAPLRRTAADRDARQQRQRQRIQALPRRVGKRAARGRPPPRPCRRPCVMSAGDARRSRDSRESGLCRRR